MRRSTRLFPLALSFTFAAASLGAAACSDTFGSSSDNGSGNGADGGVVNGGKNPPPGCNGSAEPDQDACVVSNGVGIFVSVGMGEDSADGTKEHPVKSLQKGIDLAKAAGGKNVYACAETYKESITLRTGIAVFGYFDCSTPDWKVAVDRHALVQAPTNPAVSASDITEPTVFAAFDVIAPDATKDAVSSIALLAKNAASLRVSRSLMRSGKGFDGADGTEGTQLTDSVSKDGAAGLLESTCQLGSVACAANGGDCNDASCYVAHDGPVAGGTNACSGAPGHGAGGGGTGGAGGHWTKNQTTCSYFDQTGFADKVYVADAHPRDGSVGSGGAAGGKARYSDHDTCQNFLGTDGAAGAKGNDGTDGASATLGTFSVTGFVPGDGAKGTDGSPGQGGGGGGGSLALNEVVYSAGAQTWGIVGSGGGAGGCPGLAGAVGKGGGASVVILASDSPMQLDAVTLQAGNGGRGGAGTFGSNATSGGNGGFAPEPGPSTAGAGNSAGGHGGDGGRAGVSGAGAGGSSIGLAYHGAMPNLVNGSTAVPGNGGAGQQARPNADGVRVIPASADGAAAATLSF